MQYNIHAAKTQLSKLIEATLAGEEVIIARDSQPVVRLVPLPQGGFKLGLLESQFGILPDFMDPMVEDDLEDWEGRE